MSIKKITATASDLNTNRVLQIKSLIKNIAANKHIHPQRVSSFQGDSKIVFCVTDSARITDPNQFSEHNNINERFKTINSKYTASFYEIWNKVPNTKQDYHLLRIYFHVYLSESDKDYILLHTDPLDPDITHGNYKRSPHLHIKHTSDSKIAHAHFALNINDYDTALSSLEEINKSFSNHLNMLCEQIIK